MDEEVYSQDQVFKGVPSVRL